MQRFRCSFTTCSDGLHLRHFPGLLSMGWQALSSLVRCRKLISPPVMLRGSHILHRGSWAFFHKRPMLHSNGKFVSFPNSRRLAIRIIKAWKIQAVSFGISFLGLTLRPYLRLGFLFQVLPSDHIHQEVSLLMRR